MFLFRKFYGAMYQLIVWSTNIYSSLCGICSKAGVRTLSMTVEPVHVHLLDQNLFVWDSRSINVCPLLYLTQKITVLEKLIFPGDITYINIQIRSEVTKHIHSTAISDKLVKTIIQNYNFWRFGMQEKNINETFLIFAWSRVCYIST